MGSATTSPTQKRGLNQLRKWVKSEIKSHNRKRGTNKIGTDPKFSYKVDPKTNRVLLCYSIPVKNPTLKKGWSTKQKQRYRGYLTLSNYKKSLSVFEDYEFVLNEIEEARSDIYIDEKSLIFWIDRYCSGESRRGVIKPSERTIKGDRQRLMYYHDWLTINHPKKLGIWSHVDEGKDLLLEFLNYKRDSGSWGDTTIHSCYTTIRAFFNWINSKEKLFPQGILSTLKEIPSPKPILTSFSEVEFMKLIDFMDEETESKDWGWFIPILRLMLITGVRINEVQSMRINDLTFETIRQSNTEGKLEEKEVIRWTMIGKGRDGGKERTIYIDSQTLIDDILANIKKPNGKFRTDKEYVFHKKYYRRNKNQHKVTTGWAFIEDIKKPYSISGIEHKFKKMVKHLKLDDNLTPHSCRRFFISHMLKLTGGNIPFVAQLVGHEDWSMVNHYQKNNQQQEMLKGMRNTLNIGDVIRS